MEQPILMLPVTEPVAFFSLMLGVILLVPMLFERLRLPGLVGLILAGIVIGPHGLHLVNRSNSLILLATIGLLYVMFIAGLEINLGQFKKYRQRSILLGILSFLIPQTLGTVAGLALGYGWIGSILLGSVLASHTLLAYPIVSRMGLSKRLSVTTAIGGTILTDLLALIVLAIVASGAHGQLDLYFWLKLTLSLSIYTALVIWAVPRLAQSFFKNVGTRREQEYVFVLGVMFFVAFLARVAGVEAIIGAFLAGLMLNRFLPEQSTLLNRVQFVGNAIFIPFFLIATGMLVDVRVLIGDPTVWVVAGTITGIVLFGKFSSSWITGAWYGYTPAERMTMFGLTVPQAAATLAATLTGHKLGLFTLSTVNAVVVMILVTCLIGPFLVQRFARQMVIESDAEPLRVEDAPERILVPISNPNTADSLLDLALLIRSGDHDEPIFPLMVVRPDTANTQAEVAQAEQHLAHAAIHLASADVPVMPLTRVGLNVASTVIQTATDTRASTLLLGWNGERSLKERVFGTIIDQVLEHGTSMTLVAHMVAPLVTTRRVVLLVPPLSERQPGFEPAIRLVKRLVSRLGLRLCVWSVSEESSASSIIERLPPEIPTELVALASWREVAKKLQSLDAQSLVVFLSAREGDLSWDPALVRLPQLLAGYPKRNFLVLYPPELLETDALIAPETVIHPKHAVIHSMSDTLPSAWNELYEAAKKMVPANQLVPETLPSPQWTETVNDVMVSSVRLPNWPDMTVITGVHQAGVPCPDADRPVRLMLLCLTPMDMPLAQHSAYMKWIVSQVSQPTIADHLKAFPPAVEIAPYFRMTLDTARPLEPI